MKAIILNGFGGAENLVNANLPVPEIAHDEVLIHVKAISINPVDIKTRSGRGLAGRLKELDPIILGWDISGIITGTGRNVTSFNSGDEVFGMVNFPGHGKAYAEYVAVPAIQLALKPVNITYNEAAAASLAALTAWQVLKEKIKLKPGDKILIHSAAGGVGHYAVQMARHLGAYVTGTASDRNRDFLFDLGASVHIDYENQRFEDIVHDQDFVLDSIGGEYFDRSLKVLKPGGTIISLPTGATQNITERADLMGLQGFHYLVQSSGRNIQEISDLLKKGAVKSIISDTFSFNDMQAAHIQIETGRTRGKIVVTL
jgi:NADPH:quinone reductase-like Zn-dependent oxidoreductase